MATPALNISVSGSDLKLLAVKASDNIGIEQNVTTT